MYDLPYLIKRVNLDFEMQVLLFHDFDATSRTASLQFLACQKDQKSSQRSGDIIGNDTYALNFFLKVLDLQKCDIAKKKYGFQISQ